MTLNLYTQRKRLLPVFDVNVLEASERQLSEISTTLALGLNRTEMKSVKKYFASKERNPTDVELQTIGQTWSEHCFHKTFKRRISFDGKEVNGLFKTYIEKATKEISADWCVSVFEDNAGIVKFDKGYGIAAKVETHNHPSAVEPFGGAATGTGGVIRDILGVWADPIACTDVLGFGPLSFDYDKLPQGVKHPKYVYTGVVAGIGTYGNNMGIPTVNGAICFDESYTGNVVVYCGCIGLLPLDKLEKNARSGDAIILAGGKTGQDGIHGVTFASAELTKKSEQVSRSAVQIANPIEEEKLKRAVVQIRDLGLASSITDLGGGGLSSAVGETAKRFGCGAEVELDKIPLKSEDLAPWEIYISESQERMLLTVPVQNLREAIAIFEKEDVEAESIGRLTPDGTLTLSYMNEKVGNLDINFLFEPPTFTVKAEFKTEELQEPQLSVPIDLTAVLLRLLASPNIASKENVIRTYDHEVKGNTIIKPLQGKSGGPNDAAVLKPVDDSWTGVTLSCGINPSYGKIDSYWMAASAIDEAIRNNIAVGGRRIALLDNFVWGNPERPDRLGSLVKACEACYATSRAFGTPFISGKDSLYNESPLGSVTPTLLITAVGIIPNIRNSVSMDLKEPGDPVYIVGKTYQELGGSEYYGMKGFLGKTVPKVRTDEAKKTFEAVTKAVDSQLVKACHDLSEGGLAVAAAEMAFAGSRGIDLILSNVPSDALDRDDFVLFSESNSRFLIEVPRRAKEQFERIVKGTTHAEIGKVTRESVLRAKGLREYAVVDASIHDLLASWKSTFSREAL